MSGPDDQRRGVRPAYGVGFAGRAVLNFARRPVLPGLIRQPRVDQLQRPSAPVVGRLPSPAVEAAILRATHTVRPVAPIGVGHLVRHAPCGILQHQRFPAVAQTAHPTAAGLLGPGIFCQKNLGIGRNHKQTVGRDFDVRKIKTNPSRESPAIEVHRPGVAVEQLDVFLAIILGGRVIHDLVDDDVGKIRIHPHLPTTAGKRVATKVAYRVALRPSDRDSTLRLWQKMKPIRPATLTAHGQRGLLTKLQVGGNHTGHRLGKSDHHFLQRGHGGTGGRKHFRNPRRGDVHKIVFPTGRRLGGAERMRRGEPIRDVVRVSP